MKAVERIEDLNKISFPKLGWEFNIDPTAFKIGSLEIQWYGIIITLGLVLAVLYCIPRMKRFGIDSDRAIDAVIGGVLGGIVGARAYYVIAEWDEYKGNIKEIFNTRGGGLAIYGGIIGALLVGLLICRIRKVKALPMLDVTVLGFLIGQGIGRWGNFINQEAYGSNTDSLFGMTGGRIQSELMWETTYLDGNMAQEGIEVFADYAVHPCFLYESLWCLLGFVILAFISKHRKYDGQIFLMYLGWYGAERFVVEGLRTDSLMAGNIRISQLLSAVIFVVSVILQIVIFFKRRRDPEAFVLYANTEESRQLIEESRRKRMGVPAEDIHLSVDDDFEEEFSDEDIDDEDDEDADGGEAEVTQEEPQKINDNENKEDK
ncbi:MAG: prolipoprotein diacylglyceryl transferase [Ruminococcus sp.]|nr:prolipoprotein diacylglyceryl transferase [Ruminococcus sp.]